MVQLPYTIDARRFFIEMRERTSNRLDSAVILYKEMFADDSWSRIDAAGELQPLKRILEEYVVVSVCRLLDPAYTKVKGMKRENVSLRALQIRLRAEEMQSADNCIQNWFKKHDQRIRECRELRNTYIDHLDATKHLSSTSYTGTNPTRMLRLVDATYAFLNRLSEGLGESWRNHHDVGFQYGGKGLLVMLKESAEYRRLRSDVASNKMTLEDIKSQLGYVR